MPKKPASKPLPRRPAPDYPASPLKRKIREGVATIERIGQRGKNVANTISEGVRKIKKHVGR